mmetsp:Transcript_21583/g.56252  ORF Transcript_21583/g.56252 Transcript_21583/m.56252 type:complete len:207 (+) Transcript_21583:176-796(+)
MAGGGRQLAAAHGRGVPVSQGGARGDAHRGAARAGHAVRRGAHGPRWKCARRRDSAGPAGGCAAGRRGQRGGGRIVAASGRRALDGGALGAPAAALPAAPGGGVPLGLRSRPAWLGRRGAVQPTRPAGSCLQSGGRGGPAGQPVALCDGARHGRRRLRARRGICRRRSRGAPQGGGRRALRGRHGRHLARALCGLSATLAEYRSCR